MILSSKTLDLADKNADLLLDYSYSIKEIMTLILDVYCKAKEKEDVNTIERIEKLSKELLWVFAYASQGLIDET